MEYSYTEIAIFISVLASAGLLFTLLLRLHRKNFSHAAHLSRKEKRPSVFADIALLGGALSLFIASTFTLLERRHLLERELPSEKQTPSVKVGSDSGRAWQPGDQQYDPRIQQEFDRTKKQPIVFSEVDALDYDKDSTVKVTVANVSIEEAVRGMLGLPGGAELDEADLTQMVRAELLSSNSDVEISPLGAMDKTLSKNSNTNFRWRVRPKTTQKFVLTFELYNLASVDGVTHAQDPRSWHRSVLVNATRWQRIVYTWESLGPIWQMISVLSAIACMYAAIRGLRRLRID